MEVTACHQIECLGPRQWIHVPNHLPYSSLFFPPSSYCRLIVSCTCLNGCVPSVGQCAGAGMPTGAERGVPPVMILPWRYIAPFTVGWSRARPPTILASCESTVSPSSAHFEVLLSSGTRKAQLQRTRLQNATEGRWGWTCPASGREAGVLGGSSVQWLWVQAVWFDSLLPN